MGFLDEVRRAKELAEAMPGDLSSKERARLGLEAAERERADARRARWSPYLPEGGSFPYVERLVRADAKAVDCTLQELTEIYLGLVGLRPEDVFGVYPADIPDNGDPHTISIMYRDRPEYAPWRDHFRRALAAQVKP